MSLTIERGDDAISAFHTRFDQSSMVAAVPFPPQDQRPIELLALGNPHHQMLIDVAQTPQLHAIFVPKRAFAAADAKSLAHRLIARSKSTPMRWACATLSSQLLAGGRLETEILKATQPPESLAALAERCGALATTLTDQARALRDAEMTQVSRIEARAILPLVALERAGMPFQKQQWQRMVAQEEAEQNAYLQAIAAKTKASLSNNMEAPALLDALQKAGLPLRALDKQSVLHLQKDIAELLSLYLTGQRRLANFGASFLRYVGEDGRIHATFAQIGSRTGRMACTAPNLQAMHSDASRRRCFAPSPARTLVIADYQACELRILAEMSQDRALIDAMSSGRDVHTEVAQRLFGQNQVAEAGVQRQMAKQLGFGLIYGMGAPALARSLQTSLHTAQDLTARYFEAYPRVRAFLHDTAAQSLAQGFCRTLAGRKLYLTPSTSEDPHRLTRLARNSPIQGTSADIIKVALAAAHHALKPFDGARLVHCVHDELVVEARETEAEAVGQALQDSMQAAGATLMRQVPMTAGVEVASFWA